MISLISGKDSEQKSWGKYACPVCKIQSVYCLTINSVNYKEIVHSIVQSVADNSRLLSLYHGSFLTFIIVAVQECYYLAEWFYFYNFHHHDNITTKSVFIIEQSDLTYSCNHCGSTATRGVFIIEQYDIIVLLFIIVAV